MEEEKKKDIANAVFHEKVLNKLDNIETKVTEANHRTTKLEKDMVDTKADLTMAITKISGIDHIALRLKSERDQSKDDLIEELKKYKERRFWILVTVVLFILGVVGIINADFIKAII